MRIFSIGDIHGCARALDTLLSIVPYRPEDTLVTLGDYVDRGPDSRGVIDRLLVLRSRVQLVTLRGNHEIMMLAARDGDEQYRHWNRFGGEQTLLSYGSRSLRDVTPAHWTFLEEACVPYHETAQHFFVHANAAAELPLAEQPEEMLYWQRFGGTPAHRSGKIMVCGHTEQLSGKPADIGHAICIDTRAYGQGWLTCLEVTSRMYWQANEAGSFRLGSLL